MLYLYSVAVISIVTRINVHSLHLFVFSEDDALHEPREARAVRRLRRENLRQILLARRR